jgi:hypothetical protein
LARRSASAENGPLGGRYRHRSASAGGYQFGSFEG